MIGAIIGDIIGSRFEFNNHRSTDFDLFGPGCNYTDDTVMTVAVSIGGDNDTITAICGPIAEAFYGVPTSIKKKALRMLPISLARVVNEMYKLSKK